VFGTRRRTIPPNNRNTATGWTYDADGRLLTSVGGFSYVYDAAGRMTSTVHPGSTISQTFDGDGMRAKWVENGTTTYYVRSHAIKGQVITELDQSGQKRRGYIYAGSEKIAKQENGQVLWDQHDVSGVSMRLTNSTGSVTSKIETDPLGTQVDDTATYNYNGGNNGYSFNPNGFYGDPTNPHTGCSLGGVEMDCNQATQVHDEECRMGRGCPALVVGNPWGLNNMSLELGIVKPITVHLSSGPGTSIGVGGGTSSGGSWQPGTQWEVSGASDLDTNTVTITGKLVTTFIWVPGNGATPLTTLPQNPLPTPKPTAGPSPTPGPGQPHEDCYDPDNWNRKLQDLRTIGRAIGWTVADNGAPHNRDKIGFNEASENLKKIGFEVFNSNVNPVHWGGTDYQGKVDGRWYHLTMYPRQILVGQSALGNSFKPDYKKTPARIEMHCERWYYRPNSAAHFFDYIFSWP